MTLSKDAIDCEPQLAVVHNYHEPKQFRRLRMIFPVLKDALYNLSGKLRSYGKDPAFPGHLKSKGECEKFGDYSDSQLHWK